ncbi:MULTISPECIES: ABC transporter substrate-binding protein [Arthrobacter]|uniref:Extracellular solute-binding protein n=1 Tax=Arthrobacter terricola TaxID=2547396 RepID=A0A4V2ZSL0_9MICC|nr:MULTISPECIES: extracellular solute-binding protein [Arthrobacter]MBT8159657.1 extracellular solute-binding protein [Arthrobacter sp. GN70]TDF93614.1 extracellular solute-binding protein [Arthrobacter terricola]
MKLSRNTTRAAIAAFGVAALLISATGCDRGTSASSSSEVQFFLNGGPDTPQYKEMTDLIAKFKAEKGITVNMTAASTDYEDQMKVKLASGDIPDVFTTHGWSLLRYSKFLEPLTNRSWASKVNPGLNSAMRDSDGNIYAFPGAFDTAGIAYNKDVLDKAGIDPATITTWDAFNNAAAAVAAKGSTPIFSSGKAQGPAGHIADYLAADTFTDSQLTQMKQGTFVDSAYAKVLDRVKSWQSKGWFNKDYSSASEDDMAHALANGTAAFEIYNNSILASARTYNPNANVGFIPLPPTNGSTPYLIGGEGVDSFGVSKTSKHKDDALAFLDFLAQPDNAAALAEANGAAAGLVNVKVDFGKLTSSFDKYVTSGSTPVKPYFDRVYLPNGSWNTMVATTDSVISGQSDVAGAVAQMKNQFATLYGQK